MIYSHLAQRYLNAQKTADEICPGEKNCDRFEAQGDDRACEACSKLPTKFKQVETDEAKALIYFIEQIVNQARITGVKWKHLSPFEFEALIEYQRLSAMFVQPSSRLGI